jgi:hypothetical protein
MTGPINQGVGFASYPKQMQYFSFILARRKFNSSFCQRSCRHGLIALVLVGIPFSSCFAEDSVPVQFTVRKADGTDVTGSLKKLAESWSVSLSGSKTTMVDRDNWVSLRQTGKSSPPLRFQEEQLHFANGDRFLAKIHETKGGRLRFQLVETPNAGAMQVAISALSMIWFKAPENVEDIETWRWKRATEPRLRDKAWLTNGDEVEGILKGVEAGKVMMETNQKVVDIPRDKVAVIALSTELASMLKPKTVYGRCFLTDGAGLSLLKATFSHGKTVDGTTLFGESVTIPLERIQSISLNQGRAVYLSDLKPRDYDFTSYLGSVRWPFVKDGCVENHELHVGGNVFAKGLGMHGQSRLVYDLSGKYQRFEALVGLDEKSSQQGTARIQVLIDGKPCNLGGIAELKAFDEPLSINIDISGAKQLTLVVNFGKRGSVQSHVDWADARLIR